MSKQCTKCINETNCSCSIGEDESCVEFYYSKKYVETLEAQVEKMKNCCNCGNVNSVLIHCDFQCSRCRRSENDLWELKNE